MALTLEKRVIKTKLETIEVWECQRCGVWKRKEMSQDNICHLCSSEMESTTRKLSPLPDIKEQALIIDRLHSTEVYTFGKNINKRKG